MYKSDKNIILLRLICPYYGRTNAHTAVKRRVNVIESLKFNQKNTATNVQNIEVQHDSPIFVFQRIDKTKWEWAYNKSAEMNVLYLK